MSWINKKFTITLKNLDYSRTKEDVEGSVKLGFGVHHNRLGYAVTHLKSGYKIVTFSDQEAAKQIVDYLLERYWSEFNEIDNEVEKRRADDDYRELPSVIHLAKFLRSDEYLQSQIKLFGVKVDEF